MSAVKPRLGGSHKRAQLAAVQSPPRSHPAIGDFDGRNVSRPDVPIFGTVAGGLPDGRLGR